MVLHNISPVYDENSSVLILGSFPSVRSREEGFFYGHPQNRFWKVISAVCGEPCPQTVTEKKELLLRHGIALWDVIASCDITGSSDASITNVVPNDISGILRESGIKAVLLNGKTAEKLYKKYIADSVALPAVCLPSTSPANAKWTAEKLKEEWKVVRMFTAGNIIL